MTRLESFAPELAVKLRRASSSEQRAATLAACEFAVAHAFVDHDVIHKVLEHLRTSRSLEPETKAEVKTLVERLDNEYFDLRVAAEGGWTTGAECICVFAQARAVAALSYAGDEDAVNAIYEAAFTVDDKNELFVLVDSVLGPQ